MTVSAVPTLLVLAIAVLFAGLSLALSYWFGPRRSDPLKETPYECGVPARGSVQIRFFIRFFMVALLYLLFAQAIALLIPWVLTFNAFLDAGAGGYAMIVLGVFLLILVVGLVYEWRKGGLEWQ